MSEDHRYKDGDIVWVKLGNNWWPGEVTDIERQPDGLLKQLKKKPYCVVKFFQEDAYEYVKSAKQIFPFQCGKKEEFIKKGTALYNAKNKFMEKFPSDVETAERLTRKAVETTDILIINDRPDSIVKAILGPTYTRRSNDYYENENNKSCNSDLNNKRRSGDTVTKILNITPQRTTLEPTTRTPDISKIQTLPLITSTYPTNLNVTPTYTNFYRCSLCNFSSQRQNVMILHRRTHNSPGGMTNPTLTPTSTTNRTATTTITNANANVAKTSTNSNASAATRLENNHLVDDIERKNSKTTPGSANTTTRIPKLDNKAAQLNSRRSSGLRSSVTDATRNAASTLHQRLRSSLRIDAEVREITLPDGVPVNDNTDNSSSPISSIDGTPSAMKVCSPRKHNLHASGGCDGEGSNNTSLVSRNTAEEIRQRLLADWSDGEKDDDADMCEDYVETQTTKVGLHGVKKTQTEINKSRLAQAKNKKQDNLSHTHTTSINTTTQLSNNGPHTSKQNRIRNIPKKDRRDAVLKEFISDFNVQQAPASGLNCNSGSSSTDSVYMLAVVPPNSGETIIIDDNVDSTVKPPPEDELGINGTDTKFGINKQELDIEAELQRALQVDGIQTKVEPQIFEYTQQIQIDRQTAIEEMRSGRALRSNTASIAPSNDDILQVPDIKLEERVDQMKSKCIERRTRSSRRQKPNNREQVKNDLETTAMLPTATPISTATTAKVEDSPNGEINVQPTPLLPPSHIKEEEEEEGGERPQTSIDTASQQQHVDCFDFQEDDSCSDALKSIADFKKKYLSPDKAQGKIPTTDSGPLQTATEQRHSTEQKDQQLARDIEMLLEQTADTIPAVVSRTHSFGSSSKEELPVKGLPIKERGKRIFKSRNRSRVEEPSTSTNTITSTSTSRTNNISAEPHLLNLVEPKLEEVAAIDGVSSHQREQQQQNATVSEHEERNVEQFDNTEQRRYEFISTEEQMSPALQNLENITKEAKDSSSEIIESILEDEKTAASDDVAENIAKVSDEEVEDCFKNNIDTNLEPSLQCEESPLRGKNVNNSLLALTPNTVQSSHVDEGEENINKSQEINGKGVRVLDKAPPPQVLDANYLQVLEAEEQSNENVFNIPKHNDERLEGNENNNTMALQNQDQNDFIPLQEDLIEKTDNYKQLQESERESVKKSTNMQIVEDTTKIAEKEIIEGVEEEVEEEVADQEIENIHAVSEVAHEGPLNDGSDKEISLEKTLSELHEEEPVNSDENEKKTFQSPEYPAHEPNDPSHVTTTLNHANVTNEVNDAGISMMVEDQVPISRITSPTDDNSSIGISEAGAEFGSPTSMLDDERLPLMTDRIMTPTEGLLETIPMAAKYGSETIAEQAMGVVGENEEDANGDRNNEPHLLGERQTNVVAKHSVEDRKGNEQKPIATDITPDQPGEVSNEKNRQMNSEQSLNDAKEAMAEQLVDVVDKNGKEPIAEQSAITSAENENNATHLLEEQQHEIEAADNLNDHTIADNDNETTAERLAENADDHEEGTINKQAEESEDDLDNRESIEQIVEGLHEGEKNTNDMQNYATNFSGEQQILTEENVSYVHSKQVSELKLTEEEASSELPTLEDAINAGDAKECVKNVQYENLKGCNTLEDEADQADMGETDDLKQSIAENEHSSEDDKAADSSLHDFAEENIDEVSSDIHKNVGKLFSMDREETDVQNTTKLHVEGVEMQSQAELGDGNTESRKTTVVTDDLTEIENTTKEPSGETDQRSPAENLKGAELRQHDKLSPEANEEQYELTNSRVQEQINEMENVQNEQEYITVKDYHQVIAGTASPAHVATEESDIDDDYIESPPHEPLSGHEGDSKSLSSRTQKRRTISERNNSNNPQNNVDTSRMEGLPTISEQHSSSNSAEFTEAEEINNRRLSTLCVTRNQQELLNEYLKESDLTEILAANKMENERKQNKKQQRKPIRPRKSTKVSDLTERGNEDETILEPRVAEVFNSKQMAEYDVNTEPAAEEALNEKEKDDIIIPTQQVSDSQQQLEPIPEHFVDSTTTTITTTTIASAPVGGSARKRRKGTKTTPRRNASGVPNIEFRPDTDSDESLLQTKNRRIEESNISAVNVQETLPTNETAHTPLVLAKQVDNNMSNNYIETVQQSQFVIDNNEFHPDPNASAPFQPQLELLQNAQVTNTEHLVVGEEEQCIVEEVYGNESLAVQQVPIETSVENNTTAAAIMEEEIIGAIVHNDPNEFYPTAGEQTAEELVEYSPIEHNQSHVEGGMVENDVPLQTLNNNSNNVDMTLNQRRASIIDSQQNTDNSMINVSPMEKVRINVDVANPLSTQIASILGTKSATGITSSKTKKRNLEEAIPRFIIERPGQSQQQSQQQHTTSSNLDFSLGEGSAVAHVQQMCPQVKITRKEKLIEVSPDPPAIVGQQESIVSNPSAMFDINSMPIVLGNEHFMTAQGDMQIVLTSSTEAGETHLQHADGQPILQQQQQQQQQQIFQIPYRSPQQVAQQQQLQQQHQQLQQVVGNKPGIIIIKATPGDFIIQQTQQQTQAIVGGSVQQLSQMPMDSTTTTTTYNLGSGVTLLPIAEPKQKQQQRQQSQQQQQSQHQQQQLEIAKKQKSAAAAATGGRKQAGNTITLPKSITIKQRQRKMSEGVPCAASIAAAAAATIQPTKPTPREEKSSSLKSLSLDKTQNRSHPTSSHRLHSQTHSQFQPQLQNRPQTVQQRRLTATYTNFLELQQIEQRRNEARAQLQRRLSFSEVYTQPPAKVFRNTAMGGSVYFGNHNDQIFTATAEQQLLQLQQQQLQQQQLQYHIVQSPTSMAPSTSTQPPPLHPLRRKSRHRRLSAKVEVPPPCPIAEEQQQQQQQQQQLQPTQLLLLNQPQHLSLEQPQIQVQQTTEVAEPASSTDIIPAEYEAIENKEPSPQVYTEEILAEAFEANELPPSSVMAVPSQPVPGYPDTLLLCRRVDDEWLPVVAQPYYFTHSDQQLRPIPKEVLIGLPILTPNAGKTTDMPANETYKGETGVTILIGNEYVHMEWDQFLEVMRSNDDLFDLRDEHGRIFQLTRDALLTLQNDADLQEKYRQLQQLLEEQQMEEQQQLEQQQLLQQHLMQQLQTVTVSDGMENDIIPLLQIDTSQTLQLINTDDGSLILQPTFAQPPLSPPCTRPALTNATNALLNQTPIMSPLEKPSTAATTATLISGNTGHHIELTSAVTPEQLAAAGFITADSVNAMSIARPTLGDSLAVIGVVPSQPTLLPTTVTNPAIAPPKTDLIPDMTTAAQMHAQYRHSQRAIYNDPGS